MNLRQWKDRISLETYNKKWDELTTNQQFSITAKHRVQFYTLAHRKGNEKRAE